MNRRQMLKWLAGGAALAGAGIVVAPARTIFLPPRGGWLSPPRGGWTTFPELTAGWGKIVSDLPGGLIMAIDPAVGDDYGAVAWFRREFDRMVLIDYRILRPGESPQIYTQGPPAKIQIEYGA